MSCRRPNRSRERGNPGRRTRRRPGSQTLPKERPKSARAGYADFRRAFFRAAFFVPAFLREAFFEAAFFLRRAAISWVPPLSWPGAAVARKRDLQSRPKPRPDSRFPIRSPAVSAGSLVSTPPSSSSLGNNSLGNLPPLIGHWHRRLDGKMHEIRPSMCPQSAALQPFLRVTLTPFANASQEISATKSK